MLDYFESNFLVSTEKAEFDGNWVDFPNVRGSCASSGELETVFPEAEDICAIVFTTGTTGKSKGVMLSFKYAMVFAEERLFDMTDADAVLSMAPLDKVGCVRNYGSVFLAGGTLVYYNEMAFAQDFFDVLRTYRVTVVIQPSPAAALLLESAPEGYAEFSGQIRMLFLTAAASSESVKTKLAKLLPSARLFVVYSATEVTNISFFEFSSFPGMANCVGTPPPGTKVYFADDRGNIIDDSSRRNLGIFICESPGLMSGYWKDDELTAQTIKEGRIIMADMGYAEGGLLYIAGRRDDVIKSAGHQIAPYEIENAALQMPVIFECACVPAKNRLLGEIPRLFVVMRDGEAFSSKDIYKHLSDRLETYKLPREIFELDKLPRIHGSGKIDRKVLISND
jgi:long-chain acyl-CoA synthetase